MKLVISKQPDQRHNPHSPQSNDVLRLAAEMAEDAGIWPTIDLHHARLNHWNGLKITVDRSDLDELIDCGMLDGEGCWTTYGCHALARHAGLETPEQTPYRNLRIV